MADLPVVDVTDIESVYGFDGAPAATQRIQALAAAFEKRFGQKPELFARAPGRVNLIGEHIDYEGYGVLPMAIKQDTIVAIARGGQDLVVTNLVTDKYPDVTFTPDPKQPVDTGRHTWANYFLCAYKGVWEHLEGAGRPLPTPTGLQVMVDGVVPLGSGLSSSAAIVVSSALAIAAVHSIPLTKGEVAEFACRAERHVGVTSGGMDQAISVMGMAGVAMMVDFNPVRATDVVLPLGAEFVVGHSLAVSKKAESADKKYNLRVVECRLAAAVLARALGASSEEAAAVNTLRDIEQRVAGSVYGPGVNGRLAAVEGLLHEGAYMQEEVEALLGTPLTTLYAGNAAALRVLGVVAGEGFQLRQRALHVYGEAERVLGFKAACESDAAAADKLAKLGRLMDDSHASCGGLYDCSCPELDALVGAARAAGALGARLTGAGWGGCTVSLVPEGKVPEFLAAVAASYYAPLIAEGRLKEEEVGSFLFASKPSSGAAILRLKLSGLEAAAEAAKEPAQAAA